MAAETEKADAIMIADEPAPYALTTRRVFLILAGLFLLNLLLRLFYLRYDFVNGDETVRALTASRVLEGARLYTDIVTDKPPGATYFYAAVFALFGRSMKAVHVAAALWSFATATVVYLIASRLYSRRTALWAALAFVYFSTNYLTQDMMAANTEMLMALPYTAAFYFFIKARLNRRDNERALQSTSRPLNLILAGVMTGLAVMFKQVAVFNLAFFALYEIWRTLLERDRIKQSSPGKTSPRVSVITAARRMIGPLMFIALGFSLVMALFFGWLTKTGSLADFWRYAVVLGVKYVDAMPEQLGLRFLLGRVFGYVLFNAALWSLAVWTVWRAARKLLRREPGGVKQPSPDLYAENAAHYRFDLTIALWAIASLSGVFTGGRFFGHYFIQVLPALSLLASRAVMHLGERLGAPAGKRKAQVAAALLALMFLFGVVRIHYRTAILAYETITGRLTRWSEEWGMTKREREAEEVAQILRSRIRAGEPLYIWDYGLDVYWRTGARPASRYLTPYYITGRFPEITAELAPPDEGFWPEARANLIEDLNRTRPSFIVDVSGTLLALPYPEVVDFIKANYRFEQNIGPLPARPFALYRSKQAASQAE